MILLDRIQSSADLKRLSREELARTGAARCARASSTCARAPADTSAQGSASWSLRSRSTTCSTRRVDQLVWDVGHQGYPHKILTGRNDRLDTLRQEAGLSGFLKRTESEYDTFGAGHAATAISAALGMAVGRDLQDEQFKVVAVLGDGALTCGLAYEGLNNAGASERDIVVVLNDNEMSIAPNVGAISKYLNSVQRNPLYNRLRSKIGEVADHLTDHGPGVIATAASMVRKWEESVKAFLTPGVLFEELGFRYFGPIDGHDIGTLVDTLGAVRAMTGPRLVHVVTQKGKGFPAGERGAGAAEKWHALPPGHDPATGNQLTAAAGNPQYTKVFGEGLAALMAEHDDIACITGGDAKWHGHRCGRQGASEAFLRRRHRGGARGHVRRGARDAGHSPRGRHLLHVPAARLRQHHPRRRDPAPAGRVLHGPRGPRGRGRRDAHGPLRHRLHARGPGHDRHRRRKTARRCSALLRTARAHDTGPSRNALSARASSRQPVPAMRGHRGRAVRHLGSR